MIIKSDIKRLLQYRLCLAKFKRKGFSRIYSYNLGNEAGVSPEQVRKDFSMHGITGNKKAGYEIDDLLDLLNSLFGMDVIHNVVLVGMGNIGRALANYNKQFIGQNVYITAAFDNDSRKHSKKSGVPVYSMDKLSATIKEFNIFTALITVPGVAAQDVCDQLLENGIRGILNFAPVILKVPDYVVINNINLSIEIEAIIYYLSQQSVEE